MLLRCSRCCCSCIIVGSYDVLSVLLGCYQGVLYVVVKVKMCVCYGFLSVLDVVDYCAVGD